MQKTEGKKTVIVIDEQGNKLESTYPKRAKGLIKTGRAQYVDENTICLVNLPKINILEDDKMNNNNINLEQNEEVKLDSIYVMNKIDEIIKMNYDLVNNPGLANMSSVPGAKNPIQSICETNNKMIDLLRDIYSSLQPNQNYSTAIIDGLIKSLNNAIENDCGVETIKFIVTTIERFREK